MLLLLVLGACHKKQFKLTGDETDQEAMAKCLRLSEKKHYQEAVECLEIFKNRFPDSTYALDAELKIADTYFNKKDWLLAGESYVLYIQLHPNSDKLDYAYYRAGLAYERQMSKKIDRDQSNINEAEENFASVFRRYPESPYAKLAQAKYDEIRSRAAQRNLYVGKFYFRNGEYRAAIPRFLLILQDFPGLGFEEESLYRLALAYHRLGDQEKAKGAAQLMKENYPDSKKTKKIVAKILGGSHG